MITRPSFVVRQVRVEAASAIQPTQRDVPFIIGRTQRQAERRRKGTRRRERGGR